MNKIFEYLRKTGKNKLLKQLIKNKNSSSKNFVSNTKKEYKQDTTKLFPGIENLPNEKLFNGYTIAGGILFSNRDLERIFKFFKLYDDSCIKFNNLQKRFKIIEQNFKPTVVKQTLIPAFKDLKHSYTEATDAINILKKKYEADHNAFIHHFERLYHMIWNFENNLQKLETIISDLKKSKTNLKKNQKHK